MKAVSSLFHVKSKFGPTLYIYPPFCTAKKSLSCFLHTNFTFATLSSMELTFHTFWTPSSQLKLARPEACTYLIYTPHPTRTRFSHLLITRTLRTSDQFQNILTHSLTHISSPSTLCVTFLYKNFPVLHSFTISHPLTKFFPGSFHTKYFSRTPY